VVSSLLVSFGSSVYYAFGVLWPSMVVVLYAHKNPMWGGGVSRLVGVGACLGEMAAGLFAERIGHVKYQCMVMMTIASVCPASKSI
jgi:hypothetical protein